MNAVLDSPEARQRLVIVASAPKFKSFGWYTDQMYRADLRMMNSTMEAIGAAPFPTVEIKTAEKQCAMMGMIFWTMASMYLTNRNALIDCGGGVLFRPLYWHRGYFEKYPANHKRPPRTKYGVLVSWIGNKPSIEVVPSDWNDEDMACRSITNRPWVSKVAVLREQMCAAGELSYFLNKNGEWITEGNLQKLVEKSLALYPESVLREMENDLPLDNEAIRKMYGHGFSGFAK